MTSYQNGAGSGKSLKFVDALNNPFGGMLGQGNNEDDDGIHQNRPPLSEQFDTRLSMGKNVNNSVGGGRMSGSNVQRNNIPAVGNNNNVVTPSSMPSATPSTANTRLAAAVTNVDTDDDDRNKNPHNFIQQSLDDDNDKKDKDEEDEDEWDSDFEEELLNTGLGKGDDDDDDAAVLEAFRRRRLAEMKQSYQKEAESKALGHGEVRTITQDEFLPECLTKSKSKYVVVHFFHNEFEKCKIMDHHLQKIASTHSHQQCKFVRIDAEKAPFFVVKLRIKTLPTIVVFQDGKEKTRLIGFEDLLSSSEIAATTSTTVATNFPTSRLGYWLEQSAGVLEYEGNDDDDIDDLPKKTGTGPHRSARSGIAQNLLE
mmetsp:Transcript_54296/g.131733  ORF Transcript_54296/g.131733 Transcript_54296/m.131733 type:complete len:369 (-) Transcript_54296:1726-2832(-)